MYVYMCMSVYISIKTFNFTFSGNINNNNNNNKKSRSPKEEDIFIQTIYCFNFIISNINIYSDKIIHIIIANHHHQTTNQPTKIQFYSIRTLPSTSSSKSNSNTSQLIKRQSV